MEKYELTNYQWSLIKPLIPPKTSTCDRARHDPRQLFNAIFWVLITGSPWCTLLKHYGPWHTAYNNFRKWTKDGIIAKIFESFSPNILKTTQIQIDSTYVKAHQHSSGAKKINQAIGKSRAGLTTKIHAITDSKGHAINFAITGGNTHDVTQAKELISSAIHKDVSISADRAYDCNKIVEYIEFESAKAVILSRKNCKTERDYDKEVYKNRNQIERFFNRLKQ